MPRKPQVRYWKRRKIFYCKISGQHHNLGTDKKLAERKFHEIMAAPPERPEPATIPRDLLFGILKAYVDHLRASAMSPHTVEWYRSRIQSFMDYMSAHDLHELTVAETRPYHVQEWVDSRTGLKNGSKRNLMRSIQRPLRWAKKQGYIDINPLSDMEKPRGGKRERVITDAEWKDILSLVKDEGLRDLFFVSWETGCRPQESLVVEARHVDVTNSRWLFPIGESKTETPRMVYLNEKALEITLQRMERYPTGPIFRNSAGQPWTTDAINCAFIRIQIRMGLRQLKQKNFALAEHDVTKFMESLKKTKKCRDGAVQEKTPKELCEEARKKLRYRSATKIAPKFCLYNFRHTWMNRLLTSGVDALTVAILAGHCDPSTLAKTYQHLSHAPEFLKQSLRRNVG